MHNVITQVLDEVGQRITNPIAWAGWTWEGKRPDERPGAACLQSLICSRTGCPEG